MKPRCVAQGEAATLAYLGEGIDPLVNARVHALARALRDEPLGGVREVVAAYCCLQVQYDPLALTHEDVTRWIEETSSTICAEAPAQGGKLVEIPVVYGAEHGPDLEFIASRAGLSPQEVVSLHTSRDYLCYLVGFTPGFPFLGALPPAIAAPRLATPRPNLPPGAVGIAAAQTGVYPLGGPGGWRIIGRSPLMLYEPRRSPPVLVSPGDKVRFVAIERCEFPALPRPITEWEAGEEVLEVLQPGAYTTLQDLGRWGWQWAGVPVSGALEGFALKVANTLVGNPPEAAGLEVTVMGPRLKALKPVPVAICGADLGPMVDGRPVPNWAQLRLKKGQVLSFKGPRNGARAVIAVGGGLAGPMVMGSRSTYPLGLIGAPLTKGMRLTLAGRPTPVPAVELEPFMLPQMRTPLKVRITPGPQRQMLPPSAWEALVGRRWKVSQRSDRRGMRLEGEPIELPGAAAGSITSEPNTPGVIQITPDGLPTIILREQTVGGYPKLGVVVGPDLELMARALPGMEVEFEEVGLAEAREAWRRHQQLLAEITTRVRQG